MMLPKGGMDVGKELKNDSSDSLKADAPKER
jgi:hypothetical protein